MYGNLFAAWYCLGILALCLVTFLILMPFIGVGRATGSFGFFGFLGFLPLIQYFFRKEKYDERDIEFARRALYTGFCFGFAAIGPVIASLALAHHGSDSISIKLMGLPLHIGIAVGIFASSMMIFYLYHKGDQTNE